MKHTQMFNSHMSCQLCTCRIIFIHQERLIPKFTELQSAVDLYTQVLLIHTYISIFHRRLIKCIHKCICKYVHMHVDLLQYVDTFDPWSNTHFSSNTNFLEMSYLIIFIALTAISLNMSNA